MKKGDMKKQDILKTAEARFCRYGYETTSIQDILDDLHTSKGSFYHHFISKEALLEEVCRNRALSVSEMILRELEKAPSLPEKLNLLLSGILPLEGEKLSFLLMLLPVFSMPEGVCIRNCYAKVLSEIYSPVLTEMLKKGTEEGLFSCSDPMFSARLSVLLVNQYWLEICDLILLSEKTGQVADPSDLLSVTSQYRISLERILSAPFGLIELMNLPQLKAVSEAIHQHWKQS